MAKKPRTYTPSFKFKVVMESFVKGNVAEVARKYGVNPNKLSSWRTQFSRGGHLVFERGGEDGQKKYKREIEKLENLIGKKEVEINLLKSYLDFYVPPDIK